MKHLRRFLRAMTTPLLLVCSVLVMCLPLRQHFSLLAILMYVPWFLLLRHLSRSGNSVANTIWFGFLIGAARTYLIGAPYFREADDPSIALCLTAVWVGILHSLSAVVGKLGLSGETSLSKCLIPLSIVMLDYLLASPLVLPLPQLTIAYSAADSCLIGLVRVVGPLGLGLLIALANMFAGMHEFRYQRLVGVIAVILTISVLASHDAGRPVKVVTVCALASPKALTDIDSNVDFVVLPESSIVVGHPIDGDEDSITMVDLNKSVGQSGFQGWLFSGAIIESDVETGCYRNSIYVWHVASRFAQWRDKRFAMPGGEAPAFTGIPLVEDLSAKVNAIEGSLVCGPYSVKPIAVDELSVGTAVCFEHLLLGARDAWGIEPGDTDLLIAVGRVSSLGDAMPFDLKLGQRARRIHATVFDSPVIAVCDKWAEVVLPNGEYHLHMTSKDDYVTYFSVPLWKRTSLFGCTHACSRILEYAAFVGMALGIASRLLEVAGFL